MDRLTSGLSHWAICAIRHGRAGDACNLRYRAFLYGPGVLDKFRIGGIVTVEIPMPTLDPLSPPVTGLGRVAVLDGDRDGRALTCAALTAAGFDARGYEHPEDFYKSLDHGLPAVLVVDRRLPGTSGDLVAAKLRAHLGARRPAVVVWTADPSRDSEATLLSGLVDDVVVKGEQDLAILVRRVINRAGWDPVGPGLYCHRRDAALLFKGELSEPLTPRELDLAYSLAASEGVTRPQARGLTLDPDAKTAAEVHVNVVLCRFRAKLPPALRAALVTTRGQGWRFELLPA